MLIFTSTAKMDSIALVTQIYNTSEARDNAYAVARVVIVIILYQITLSLEDNLLKV